MNNSPFFSVIIPTYNRAGFLKIAAESVLCQGFDDYELIIIDDGSTDDTKRIGAADKKIRYFYQKHMGVSAARNAGLAEAKGKWICFLDSDDRFRKEKLEIASQYIKQNPQYKIFHTKELWYKNGNILSQKKHHKKTHGDIFADAARICSIGMSTSVANRRVFTHIGSFDEALPACEDYDFWLRATAKYQVFLIPEYLTIKQGGHPDQLSKKYPAMDRFRIQALKKIMLSGELEKEQYETAYQELKKKCLLYSQGALKRGKNEEAKKYAKLILQLQP